MPPPIYKQWHGEAGQDAFAYEICKRINNGTFLDLGCAHPWENSNSYSLEKLGWRGLLVDEDSQVGLICSQNRVSPVLVFSAQNIKWKEVLPAYNLNLKIDFLSIDVEGAELDTLKKLFAAGLSFNVITIEHNRYSHGDVERDAQRELLFAHGYKLVVPDVQNSTGLEFEDWWTA